MDKIRNLRDLENRKLELKQNISNSFSNPLGSLTSFVKTVSNKKRRKEKYNFFDKEGTQRNELLDEGAKAVLTLAASALVSRFKLGTIPKMIITSGVAFATPYIVDAIQKKLKS